MTPSLRRRHRLIWVVSAFLLPILFIAALWVIPEPAIDGDFNPPTARPYSEPIGQASTEAFSGVLRRDGNLPGWQLEVQLKEHLAAASIQLYLAENGQRRRLLGHLQAPGSYFFHFFPEAAPSTDVLELQLYDGIKRQALKELRLPIQGD
ncbi:MAG: hypothetical protein KDC43_14155 [Saprospiraceae bacterium]|nr:hypothetical protein [Saprospiraceae bacterium]MCB0625015.1 hypothetical protein [Saprospiraceae bacterium]MCB0676679.1 hypothetical protein [Saprospiraceae bacterium]MCB0684488.1 hypothetical protein [Saprospiraceae bacterium]